MVEEKKKVNVPAYGVKTTYNENEANELIASGEYMLLIATDKGKFILKRISDKR